MLKKELLLNFFFSSIHNLSQQYGKRTVFGTLSLVIFLLFADTLLPMFWHFLILIWHITEAFIEHCLEELFGISHWHADFVTFWICTGLATFIGWHLAIQCYQGTKTVCHTCKCKWQNKPKRTRCAIVAAVAAALVVFNM